MVLSIQAKIGFIVGLALPVLLAGCGREPAGGDIQPPRMVSFSPALTRMAFELGLGGHVAGVTRYCILPAGQTRPVVGDTLNIRVEPILAVRPELIVTQSDPAGFESVVRMRPEIRIEHFRIETLAEIGMALERMATLLGQVEAGRSARSQFEDRLERVRRQTAGLPRKKTLFILGHDSPSGPGRDTFTDEMIERAGGVNILHDEFTYWKRPSLEHILTAAPEVVICQTDPSQEAAALKYWTELFDGRAAVFVVTDSNWTIPAGHLAGYTAALADMIHPRSAGVLPAPRIPGKMLVSHLRKSAYACPT